MPKRKSVAQDCNMWSSSGGSSRNKKTTTKKSISTVRDDDDDDDVGFGLFDLFVCWLLLFSPPLSSLSYILLTYIQ
jgi:hypothetical protein